MKLELICYGLILHCHLSIINLFNLPSLNVKHKPLKTLLKLVSYNSVRPNPFEVALYAFFNTIIQLLATSLILNKVSNA
jgi:hypothetical protein